jgi:hypothetical protein
MGQEEPFPARRLSGREGWIPVLRRHARERRGSALNGPSRLRRIAAALCGDPVKQGALSDATILDGRSVLEYT